MLVSEENDGSKFTFKIVLDDFDFDKKFENQKS